MTSEITKAEELIYNTYLRNLRKNQPYKPRQDFTNLDNKTRIELYKLKNFFNKFRHIDPNFFFDSFRFVYPNDNFPPLHFFTTRKAIKCYTLHKKGIEDSSPDNQLEAIKNGLAFMGTFCVHNKIPFEKYISHKTLCMPSWTQHYRENKVNIYSLLCVDSLNDFYNFSEEEKSFWAPHLVDNLEPFKIRLHNCKSKNKIQSWVNHIKNFVNTELTNLTKQTNIKNEI
jgi:hypothetical protein